MVRTQYPAAALQGVSAQAAGQLRLARKNQRKGEPAPDGQGVGMVGAEDYPPAVEQRFADDPAAGAVAVNLQIAEGVQDQVPAGGRVITQGGGGQHVRSELGVAGPAG